MNGAGLTSGSIAGSRACGGGSSVGAETRVDNELAEIGEFSVGGSKERISKLSLRICFRWRVGDDERQVVRVLGRGGGRGRRG